MGESEPIRVIGHSQGAAFAAGMVSILAKHEKYSSKLEVVHYLSSHQPNGFNHDSKIPAHQWSTESDQISSKNKFWDWIKGKSRYQRINGVDETNFHGRKSHNGGYGGHSADTWLDDLVKYFQSLEITVNVVE